MKRPVVPGGLWIGGALAVLLCWPSCNKPETAANAPPAPRRPASPPPTATLSDPAEVFQRAFWKRPSPEDKILHAERREWSDGGALQQWQWFIVVEPSAALVKHLREDNAFNLAPADTLEEIPDAPAWFSPSSADVEVLKAPGGNLRLVFSKTAPLLYACDRGKGFSAGAPEATPAPLPPASSGRLPNAPPPQPKPR